MELNDAFPCARGCPQGFYCEMQDAMRTSSIGICCANRTELRLLYGDDNRQHADPIWHRDAVAATSARSTSTAAALTTAYPSEATESSTQWGSVRVIAIGTEFHPTAAPSKSSTEPIETTAVIPTVIISENDIVSDTTPTSVPADAEEITATESANQNTTAEAVVTTLAVLEVEADDRKPRSEGQPEQVEVQISTSLLLPETTTTTTTTTNLSTDNATEVVDEVVTVEATPSLLETTSVSSNATLVEELALAASSEPQSAGSENAVSPAVVGRSKDEAEKEDTLTGNGASAEEVHLQKASEPLIQGEEPVVEPEPSSQEESPNLLADQENEIGKLADDSSIEKNTQQKQALSTSEEIQTSYSCERQPYIYHCHSGSVITQPTIRWYLNEDGQCEYYPWGYCPGDRVVESTTIRTKAECERECLNGRASGQTGVESAAMTPDVRDDIESRIRPNVQIMEKDDGDMQIAVFNEGAATVSLLNPANDISGSMELVEPQKVPEGSTVAIEPTTSSGGTILETTKDMSDNMESEPLLNPANDQSGSIELVEPQKAPEGSTVAIEPTTSSDGLLLETAKDMSDTMESEQARQQPKETSVTSDSQAASDVVGGDDPSTTSSPGGDDMLEQQAGSGEVAASNQPQNRAGSSSESELGAIRVSFTEAKSEEEPTKEVGVEVLAEQGQLSAPTPDEQARARTSDPEVACSRSTYRFLCESGMPSQFVYRWEWENGKCQSFPYGYCLSEWNHPHPRTEAECQRYCGV